jgi:dCTP deaminase
MMLSAKRLSEEIRDGNRGEQTGIVVIPSPNLAELELSGEPAINLRLGRWFLTMRQANETHIDLSPGGPDKENRYAKQNFVPFGETFVLHPGRFALASTLEWIKLPARYSALVIGKSTLGRRGIIIETAAGVHPGFSGCLTLEIANVGEIPVKLISGMLICQIFIYAVEDANAQSKTSLSGQRKPRLGRVKEDRILAALRDPHTLK